MSDRTTGAGGETSVGSAPNQVILARRLHPAYLLISAGETIRGLFPVVVGLSIFHARWWLLAVAGIVIVGLALARWWTRMYAVDSGLLRLRSGLLSRAAQAVPLSRITAVEAHRGLVQRLFRVWALRIQVPGDGESAALRLQCLSAASLAELLAVLDAPALGPRPDVARTPAHPPPRPDPVPTDSVPANSLPAKPLPAEPVPAEPVPAEPVPAEPVPAEPVPVAVLTLPRLLLAALTSTSVPLLLVGAFASWNRLHELLPAGTLRWLRREATGSSVGTWWLVAVLLTLALTGATAVTSLRLARFTVIREPGRLRITRGLLAQRSGTVLIDRIQGVRIVEGLWRRPFGYCSLEVEVAGLAGRRESERLLFPLLRTAEVPQWLSRAVPEIRWAASGFDRGPARASRRYLTVPVLVAAVLSGLLLLLPGTWRYLALGPLPLAGWLGLAQARSAGWRLEPDVVSFRWLRVLARHTVIARRARVQLTRVSTTVFQRRAGLARVHIVLSSRRPAGIRHLDRAEADRALHLIGRSSRGAAPAGTAPAGTAPAGTGPAGTGTVA